MPGRHLWWLGIKQHRVSQDLAMRENLRQVALSCLVGAYAVFVLREEIWYHAGYRESSRDFSASRRHKVNRLYHSTFRASAGQLLMISRMFLSAVDYWDFCTRGFKDWIARSGSERIIK